MSTLKIRRSLADKLHAYVNENVKASAKLLRAEKRAYNAAANAIAKALLQKFPHEDMKVLQRYDKARRTKEVRIQKLRADDSTDVVGFAFHADDDRAPLSPIFGQPAWSLPVLALGQRAATLVEKYHTAKEAAEIDQAERRKAYATLIETGTAKQIAEFWPEAEPIITSFKANNLPAAVTKSVIQRIHADMAERRAAA